MDCFAQNTGTLKRCSCTTDMCPTGQTRCFNWGNVVTQPGWEASGLRVAWMRPWEDLRLNRSPLSFQARADELSSLLGEPLTLPPVVLARVSFRLVCIPGGAALARAA